MRIPGPDLLRPLYAALPVVALATAPAAQTDEELLAELISDYRDACVADDQAYWAEAEELEPEPPYDPFELSERAIYRIPVAEGVEALVLHAEIRCGYFGWLYGCGTAGCGGHLIVEGSVYDYWGHPPISVQTEGDGYQVLLPFHGTRCRDAVDPDAYTAPGFAPCYAAVTWFDGRFVSREPVLFRRELGEQ